MRVKEFGFRDLFWIVVTIGFFTANCILLNENSAALKALRLAHKDLEADVMCLYKHSGDDFEDIATLRKQCKYLNDEIVRLSKYSGDDFVGIDSLRQKVNALETSTSLLTTKVGRLEEYSASDYFSLAKVNERVNKLEDRQNIEYRVLNSDLALLEEKVDSLDTTVEAIDEELHNTETKRLEGNRELEQAVDRLREKLTNNAEMVALALNDVNLTCSGLSATHLGNLYASDESGKISIVTSCNGKYVDQPVDESWELQLDPELMAEIESIKADVQTDGQTASDATKVEGCEAKFPNIRQDYTSPNVDSSAFLKPAM